MGKRVKKKSRALQKEKEKKAHSPKVVPQQSSSSGDVVDDGVAATRDRKVCDHLEKGFNLNTLSEKLGSSDPCRCEDCREAVADKRGAKGKGKHGKRKGGVESKPETKAIWVCLECGHFACGGVGLPTTSQSHAIWHARQTRHPVVIQWENPHLRWCFQCNTLLPVEKTEENGEKKDALLEVVKLIKGQSSEQSSADVEDVWFGGGNVASEIKAEATFSNSWEGRRSYVVRGLVNLGNTCFFNSIMQNLLAMDKLQDYFSNEDASFGPVSIALKKLFIETKAETDAKNVINPRSFFWCVCSKYPQFRGYQQQDSHELLRCLLDGLSTEELAVRKQRNASKEGSVSPKHCPTFVDSVFGGQISSTVRCIDCGHSSTVYEPFLDLSLSVPTKKPPAKKVQSHCRAKKTKLPPKRGGKTRQKMNKDKDAMLSQSVSNSSETMVSSSSDITASSYSGPAVVGDENGKVSESFSALPEPENEPVVQATTGQMADSLNESWLDYLGPETVSDENDSILQNNIMSVGQYSKDKGLVPNDSLKERNELCVTDGDPNQKPDPYMNPWEDEVPLQVQSSEVLLLPYKEESFTDGEITRGEAEASSSVLSHGQDEVGFDGFGDLFNEPEVFVGPVAGPSLGNEVADAGFVGGNGSESDPDEVDDTDSPVSVQSCLAHFIKPELLSNDNAWECENCSKIVRCQMLEEKKMKAKTASKTLMNGGESLVSDNGRTDCSKQNCMKTESDQTVDVKLFVSSREEQEQEGEMHSAPMDQSMLSSCCKSCSEESLNAPAVDSCFADEPSSNGHATVEDQQSDYQFSVNCESEQNDDDEKTSTKVNVKRDATKSVLIDKAPPILTIHLKRFSQDARGRLSKLNGHVCFRDILDLRPYLDPRCVNIEKYVYHLLGVVEHLGTMRGGHYVAYIRGEGSKDKSRNSVWYHASDAYVREVSLDEVLGCEAYILFYERT